MDKDIAISVENVTMSFILNKEKVDNLKEYAIKLITGKLEYNNFDALKDINFKVKKGEHLAIMGLNGAGKSTLLKTIVGQQRMYFLFSLQSLRLFQMYCPAIRH